MLFAVILSLYCTYTHINSVLAICAFFFCFCCDLVANLFHIEASLSESLPKDKSKY